MYIDGITPETLITEYGSPLYVYDAEIIKTRFRQLRKNLTLPDARIYYAAKANANIAILRLLREEGVYFNAVSPGEIFLALEAGFNPKQIMFTGDNLPIEDIQFAIDQNILMNIDSLSQLATYGKLNPNSAVSLRVNPGIGDGFHIHAITAGTQSKFGIDPPKLEEAKIIADAANISIVGLHMHIGSGILQVDPLHSATEILLNLALEFEELEYINLGGGIGVPYRPDESPFELETYFQTLNSRVTNWTEEYGRQVTLAIEPGKFLLAEAGVLLIQVTAIKEKDEKRLIGVNSGFNHLIRPALYGAYHEIIPVSNAGAASEWTVDIAGYLCENSDFFAKDRPLPAVKEGDLLAVMNTGAYGYALASNYNCRLLPAEVLISNGESCLIRRRQEFVDLLAYQQG